MTTHIWFSFGILSFCTALAPCATAQQPEDAQGIYSSHDASVNMQGFSSRLRGRSDFSNTGREWVADLERTGLVNRSLRGPYRIAVPLMSFGAAGPKLMITYARKLPGQGDNGVLLFVNIPLE